MQRTGLSLGSLGKQTPRGRTDVQQTVAQAAICALVNKQVWREREQFMWRFHLPQIWPDVGATCPCCSLFTRVCVENVNKANFKP